MIHYQYEVDIIYHILNMLEDELRYTNLSTSHNNISPDIKHNLKKHIHTYNKEIHGDDAKCIFCLELFKDKKNPKVITCTSCNQSFCAGTDNMKDNECAGLIFNCKYNNNCPCCRKDIKDWDIFEENNKTEEVNKRDEINIDKWIESVNLNQQNIPYYKKSYRSQINYREKKKYKTQFKVSYNKNKYKKKYR